MVELHYGDIIFPVTPNAKVTRMVNSSVFTRDEGNLETDYDFTIPVDIPLTDEAIIALGFPNHLSTQSFQQLFDMYLVVDGVFVNQVTVRVLKVDTAKRTANISIYGAGGSYANVVTTMKLSQLHLGGNRSLLYNPSDAYYAAYDINMYAHGKINYKPSKANIMMNDIASGALVTDFVFYPALDEKSNITDTDTDTTRHFFNLYNGDAALGAIGFADPVKMNILLQNADVDDRYYWVPFFRLIYVLRCCFEEFGFKINSDLLTDSSFNKITLYNTYAINRVNVNEKINISDIGEHSYEADIVHDGNIIYPGNHVPDMTIMDFLQAVANKCSLQYFIDYSNKTVTIKSLSRIMIGDNLLDISSFSSPDWTVNNENQNDYTNGYLYTYDFDPNNTAQSDFIQNDVYKSVNNTRWSSRYANHPFDLPNTGLSENDIGSLAYVRSEDAFYQWDGNSWIFYCNNLMDYSSNDVQNIYMQYGDSSYNNSQFQNIDNINVAEIKTKCIPMPMKRVEDIIMLHNPDDTSGDISTMNVQQTYVDWLMPWGNSGMGGAHLLIIKKPPVGAIPADNYIGTYTVQDYPAISLQPHICNWLGLMKPLQGSTQALPFGSVMGIDANSYTTVCYELSWGSSDRQNNLYWKFFNSWVNMVKNSIDVDCYALIDVNTYKKMNPIGTPIIKEGQLFVIKKAEIGLDFPSYSLLTLARL